MKKANRLLLAVFLAALVAVSWLIALTQKSDKEKQAELMAQANAYLADEVYVLAIPIMEDALQYDTEDNDEIEAALKNACIQLIDQSEYEEKYTELLEQEMERADASAEVFKEAADYYIGEDELSAALTVLKNGIEKTGSEELVALYEEHRYAYELGYNTYEAVTAIYNGGIAVKRDGLWGIASANGALALPCAYESISNYLTGRVLISEDGTVSAIDMDGNRLALLHEDALSFAYSGTDAVMLQLADGWHMASSDFSTILSTAYEELRMLANGYAAAKQDGKWGLVNTAGEWLVEPEHDEVLVDELGRSYAQDALFVRDGTEVTLLVNGEDGCAPVGDTYEDARPFADAYAAVEQDGKWGFVDTGGTLVIDYQFEEAKSFGQHLAAVRLDGKWGYIDLAGNVVIPCEFEDAGSFAEGCAPVKLEDGWVFLVLEEYT